MSIIDRQRKVYEEGIIRLGTSVKTKSAKGTEFDRPVSLGKFRLTSANKTIIEAAASVFGGDVVWCDKVKAWEVVTERTQLKGYFSARPLDPHEPDGDCESLSTHYEFWKGHKCLRRCNGRTCEVWQGKERVPVACECDEGTPPKDRCKKTSRLKLVLSEIPSVGLWRVNTSSEVFDSETAAFIQSMRDFGLDGSLIPVLLTYDYMENSTAPGEASEKFPVVRLSVDPSPVSLPKMIDQVKRAALAVPAPSLGDRAIALANVEEAPALEHKVETAEHPPVAKGQEPLAEFTEEPPRPSPSDAARSAYESCLTHALAIGCPDEAEYKVFEGVHGPKARLMLSEAVKLGLSWDGMIDHNRLSVP